MKKPIRKLYRLTLLNEEIKRIECLIYKGIDDTEGMKSFLQGLKRAKELVMLKPKAIQIISE